ncbi:MAG: flavodoxin family protein [Thermoleophilia bacterium]
MSVGDRTAEDHGGSQVRTVLGIAGSPRRDGNSETLLDWCLEGAERAGARVVKFRLRELKLRGCVACDGCFDAGFCVQQDDMQELYPHLRSAESVVLASPIYSMGMAAQPKAMVDRCQPFWAIKYVLRRQVWGDGRPERRGAFLCCSGTTLDRVFEGALQVSNYFFHVLEAAVVGEVLVPGVDAKGDIEKHPQARDEAGEVGRLLAAE